MLHDDTHIVSQFASPVGAGGRFNTSDTGRRGFTEILVYVIGLALTLTATWYYNPSVLF